MTQPDLLLLLAELRGRLIRFGEESPEHARISNENLFSIENAFKAYRGQQEALVDPELIAAKRDFNTELRAKVMKDKALSAEIGDPWAEISKVQADRRALFQAYSYMEARAGILSSLFADARAIVRAAQEKAKPNSERLPEYTDSRLALLEKRVLDDEPVYPELEALVLEFWLTKLREHLTADAPGTRTFLGKDSPEGLAARLSKSKLADAKYRKQLWDGGLAAVQASDDPMIRFRARHRRRLARGPQGVRDPRHRPVRPRLGEDRQGALRRLRHRDLSGRDLLAAPELRQGRGLDRQRHDRPALHLLPRAVGARDGPGSLRAAQALGGRAGQVEPGHRVRLLDRQRHRGAAIPARRRSTRRAR